MDTLHEEVQTFPVSIIVERDVRVNHEVACTGIASASDEIVDMEAPAVRRGGVGGFQHMFEFCEPRTDSATTVHTMDDLIAEAE